MNWNGDVVVTRERQWAAYDALPPALRRVWQLAPDNYAMPGELRRWERAQQKGVTLDAFRNSLIANLCDEIRFRAARDYGPDHPDAQRSRLERRA